jgi:hypothetical protein
MLEWCFKTPSGWVCVSVSLLTVVMLATNPKLQRQLGLR